MKKEGVDCCYIGFILMVTEGGWGRKERERECKDENDFFWNGSHAVPQFLGNCFHYNSLA